MPRLVNQLPKYSSHKPSGQAKVRFNGKTTYRGKYGSPESKERYAAFIATLPKPEEWPVLAAPVAGATLLVGEVVNRFFEHAQTYYARAGVPTGEHVTIRCCLRPLTKRFGELSVPVFVPKKLKTVREDITAVRWSRRYVNKS